MTFTSFTLLFKVNTKITHLHNYNKSVEFLIHNNLFLFSSKRRVYTNYLNYKIYEEFSIALIFHFICYPDIYFTVNSPFIKGVNCFALPCKWWIRGRFLPTFPGRCILLNDLVFYARSKVKQITYVILCYYATQNKT